MRNCRWLFFVLLVVSCTHRRPAQPTGAADDAAGTARDAAPTIRATVATPAPDRPSLTPAPVARVTAGYRIGVVRAVGSGNRFVLFETGDTANPAVASGQELRCYRPAAGDAVGQTALVRVSRERKPPFVVADVVSGQPQAGDEVVYTKTGAASPPPAPTPPVSSFLLPPGLFPANPGTPPAQPRTP